MTTTTNAENLWHYKVGFSDRRADTGFRFEH